MGPSPTYYRPEAEECETSVEHGLPLWAEPAVGYCSRRPPPSPMGGGRFVGARAVGPLVGEQKPLGKTPWGQPQSRDDLPTYLNEGDRTMTHTNRPSHKRTAANAVNANATVDLNTSEPADTSVNAVRHPQPPAKKTVDPGPKPAPFFLGSVFQTL